MSAIFKYFKHIYKIKSDLVGDLNSEFSYLYLQNLFETLGQGKTDFPF